MQLMVVDAVCVFALSATVQLPYPIVMQYVNRFSMDER